jgi:hypothetical protein
MQELELLESFRALIRAAEEGVAVPSVSEDDLKRLHELRVEMPRRNSGKDGVVSLNSMARPCPSANLSAVWLRHSQLRLLVRQGLLAEWQHGTDLDAAVRLAATIPIYGGLVDEEAFIQRLRDEAAA